MPFEKNDSRINREGRPLGSPDRITPKIREMFRNLVEEFIPILKKDLSSMDSRDRVNAIIKLSNFVLPKLQSIQINEMPEIAELLMLTPEERKLEILRLKREIKNEQNR